MVNFSEIIEKQKVFVQFYLPCRVGVSGVYHCSVMLQVHVLLITVAVTANHG